MKKVENNTPCSSNHTKKGINMDTNKKNITKVPKNSTKIENIDTINKTKKRKIMSKHTSVEDVPKINKKANKLNKQVDKVDEVDNKANEKMKLKVLDLFCGCGGMTEGLKKAGLDIIAGIDIWDRAIESYESNNDHLAICADLTVLKPAIFKKKYNINYDIDLIVGGPPCQGFSIAGKRDIDDPRNSLFVEYYNYLTFFKPKAFIMENVIGILSMKTKKGEKVIDIITNLLEKNYNISVNKLYASDFEVPQNRRRTIIIGVRKDLKIELPEIKPVLTVDERIPVKTILEDENSVDEKQFLSERAIKGINLKKEKSKQTGKGFGAQFLNPDRPSYTIPARYWKDGYDALVKYSDTRIRRLTVNELKKIQSFPEDYVLKGSKKDQIMQIGNAVACQFAYHLGKYIIKILQ